MPVHAEIEYTDSSDNTRNSTICPPKHEANFPPEYREFMPNCLDEWFDNSGGTGHFYIAQEGSKILA